MLRWPGLSSKQVENILQVLGKCQDRYFVLQENLHTQFLIKGKLIIIFRRHVYIIFSVLGSSKPGFMVLRLWMTNPMTSSIPVFHFLCVFQRCVFSWDLVTKLEYILSYQWPTRSQENRKIKNKSQTAVMIIGNIDHNKLNRPMYKGSSWKEIAKLILFALERCFLVTEVGLCKKGCS